MLAELEEYWHHKCSVMLQRALYKTYTAVWKYRSYKTKSEITAEVEAANLRMQSDLGRFCSTNNKMQYTLKTAYSSRKWNTREL